MGRTEREQLTVCVTELWITSLAYMKKLWSLRSSILAAPPAVQRQLCVNPATLADVEGMLARPYSQRDRRHRSNQIARSLARFCQVKRLPPPTKTRTNELSVDFEEPAGYIHSGIAWQSNWLPWLNGLAPKRARRRAENAFSEEQTTVEPEETPGSSTEILPVSELDALVLEVVTTHTMIATEDSSGIEELRRTLPTGSGVLPCPPVSDNPETRVRVQEDVSDEGGPNDSLTRRNPTRSARPPKGLDLDTWDFADSDFTACGLISPDRVSEILAGEGAELISHPDDHVQMWIRRSVCCPEGGYGLFFAAPKGGLRAGYLLAIYTGDSTDSLKIGYREALTRWSTSDYVFSDPAYRYVVNGNLTCAAARANESFGDTNVKLWFNGTLRRAELRLSAPVREGFYEGLTNYTAPHQPSPYWTEEKLVSLPLSTQQRARKFYCEY